MFELLTADVRAIFTEDLILDMLALGIEEFDVAQTRMSPKSNASSVFV